MHMGRRRDLGNAQRQADDGKNQADDGETALLEDDGGIARDAAVDRDEHGILRFVSGMRSFPCILELLMSRFPQKDCAQSNLHEYA